MRQARIAFILVAALATSPGAGAAQRPWAGVAAGSGEPAVPRDLLERLPNPASAWGSAPLRIGGSAPLRISWSRSDVALASAFTASLLMDAGQTRGLARGGWQEFREANPLLGSRPGVGRINAYTAVAGLTVLGVAAALPARARPWFLCAALAVEALTVARNARQGIPIRLP